MPTNEPIKENAKCNRCGRTTTILSNGLCLRCDNVLYGRTREVSSLRSPKELKQPFPSEYPKRKRQWC